jgi:hypothetical protein
MFGPDDAILGTLGSSLISGVGSFLGTQQANAQSVKNMYNQAAINNVSQDRQGAINSQLMSQQGDINASLQREAANTNAQSATTAYQRSQEQLGEVESYNTTMANTAFQRQVKDLRAAGLNPILGIGGSGASAPTVSASAPAAPTTGAASVSGQSVGMGGVNSPTMQNALGNAVSSAMQGSKLFTGIQQAIAEVKNTQDTNNLIRANANKANAETASEEVKSSKLAQYYDAMIGQLKGQTSASQAQAGLTQKDIEYKYKPVFEVAGEAGIPGVFGGKMKTSGPIDYLGAAMKSIGSAINPKAAPYGGLNKPSFDPKETPWAY